MTVFLTIVSVVILAELVFTEVEKYANILEALSTNISVKRTDKNEKTGKPNWKLAFAAR